MQLPKFELPQLPSVAVVEQPTATRKLHKVPRTALNAWKLRQIKNQGGVCPVSGKAFDIHKLADAVVDHDHITGEIRGVLTRSANAVEGKVKNAVARWGGTGEDYSKIIPYLKRLVAYLEQPGTGFMYPMHKTPDEKREAASKARREAAAALKARRELARQKRLKGT